MLNGRHRLPSGFGTIRNLGAGRRRPYAVHPPAVAESSPAHPDRKTWKRPSAICYVANWESGLKVLALYHAGVYQSGMEDRIESGELLPLPEAKAMLWQYCQQVLKDLSSIGRGERPARMPKENKEMPTFAEVYEAYLEHKYGPHAKKELKHSTRNATHSAYKRFARFYHKTLDDISVDDLQHLVNEVADAGLSKSTVSRVVTLAHQIYRYAYPRGLCTKESGRYVEMPAAKQEEHHQDFTDEELQKLWQHQDDPIVQNILVMCHSGFRVNEYTAENFTINLEENYFQGGFKTDAGRDRIVPIHSAIRPLLSEMNGVFFQGKGSGQFRIEMKEKLVELGIDGVVVDGEERYHTPHSCRHTFSRLCESFEVNEADRKRMMGHSLRNDITNGVYGHRTVKELRDQLEKIVAACA